MREVLRDLGRDRSADDVTEMLPENAERLGRRDDEQRLRLLGCDQLAEIGRDHGQELDFARLMEIGRLDGAARAAVRLVDTAGPVGAEVVRRRLELRKMLDRLQVDQFGVALVAEEQRLGAVADHHQRMPRNRDVFHLPFSLSIAMNHSS